MPFGLDVVYVAFNRRAFTQASFTLLLRNTNWDRVRKLLVYDDGSTDGTREWLDGAIRDAPVETKLIHLGFGSPVAVMLDYLHGQPGQQFLKVDNDIAVPPGYLDRLLDLSQIHPELMLIGMEAGQTFLDRGEGVGWDGVYRPWPCSHIGGIGLMKTSAFRKTMPHARGRFGFTEWQHRARPERAWIAPDLLVPQMDRIPDEPWRSWSQVYVEEGWQRGWPLMDSVFARPYWDWIPADVVPDPPPPPEV